MYPRLLVPIVHDALRKPWKLEGAGGGSARIVAHAHNYFTRELRGKEKKMAEQGELREEPMEIDTTVPNGSKKKGTVDPVSEAASKPAHDLPWYDCSDRY